MSSQRVLFLDLDGPMIPGRAYSMPGQTKPIVKTFDPCAVGQLNEVCKYRDYKIVLHSSWVRIFGGENTYHHCVSQGINANLFHADAWCDEQETWRYTRVAKWLAQHPEVTDYFILDDEPYQADNRSDHPHPEGMAGRLILVDFNEGLLKSTVERLYTADGTPSHFTLENPLLDIANEDRLFTPEEPAVDDLFGSEIRVAGQTIKVSRGNAYSELD